MLVLSASGRVQRQAQSCQGLGAPSLPTPHNLPNHTPLQQLLAGSLDAGAGQLQPGQEQKLSDLFVNSVNMRAHPKIYRDAHNTCAHRHARIQTHEHTHTQTRICVQQAHALCRRCAEPQE